MVTERDSARVLRLSPTGKGWDVAEIGTIEAAAPAVEGGLLGVATSPDFAADRTLYFYVTAAEDNRIMRAELTDDGLGPAEPLLTGIPKGAVHDGGRLAFGPDGMLYASTGETGQRDLAQDPDSLGGKILRITADGEPAPGNPDPSRRSGPSGHRNVQGLAWDDRDRLWAAEFGDSTWDELNLVEKGGNYGWPAVEGRTADRPGGRSPTLSPSGAPTRPRPRAWRGLRGRCGWAPCAAPGCGRSPVTADGVGHPEGPLRGRLRPLAHGGAGSGRHAVGDDVQPRRPGYAGCPGRPHPPGHPVALTRITTARRATRRSVASTAGPSRAMASALVIARPVSQPPVEVTRV